MKFLNEEGKIVEGTPLTDEQVDQRERLITYFHDTVCKGKYHGTYDTLNCEILATAYVTGEIAKIAGTTPSPEPMVYPEAPQPVAVKTDDCPF